MLAIDENGCKKLIRFLFEIKKRPLLFLKEKSLKQIAWLQQGFIFGYNNACDYGLIEFHNRTKEGNLWADFQFYFSDKYKTSSVEHLEVIALCGSDEKAFDLFFEELELFLKEQNVEIPEIR